ncbi:hypothetical protein E1B28_003949 [Marasmius oreades]|uniref:RRM domain-containing protein n=1 Tax=Marasmius oreades TaxID=181124 RepID=A0A9P7UXM3_9AGAR|nr:uncharacterized protein E1B28_003949 [Marasmius oreades]KAG7096520.1 hypothetical protein E1B28_003949 [Marasmius oreades]
MATTVLDSEHGRILCIADIRGHLSILNDLARDANAVAIIHTGDFGFFDASSLDRINDRTLRHLATYSPLIPTTQRTHLSHENTPAQVVRQSLDITLLSEFPLLLSSTIKLNVPVFTVWGACEDVQILEKLRLGTYTIPNLHVLDEAHSGTHLLEVAGLKLRLFGLGGALVPHKMFDNGDANATIAGGSGTMWTTALQIGQLVDTAQRAFDPTETRLLVTHASPGREGIIAQLALVLKADLTVSAGLHFRYASSYNEFSVQNEYETFRKKLISGKEQFYKIWESVKTQVDAVIDEHQRVLLNKALYVIERIPPAFGALITNAQGTSIQAQDEPSWKNCWNWNLCDAAYGSLVLDIREGRVSAELKSQGFNYAYRRTATAQSPMAPTGNTPTRASPAVNVQQQEKAAVGGTPVPTATSVQPNAKATPAQSPKALPPHLTNASRGGSGRGTPANTVAGAAPASAVATPPTQAAETPASAASSPVAQTPTNAHSPNGTDKADRERQKRERKKEKKEKEKAERTASAVTEKEGGAGAEGTRTSTPASSQPQQQGHKAQPSTGSGAGRTDEVKSPVTEGGGTSGARTPRGNKPARNPWTIFLRLTVPTTEADLKEFFGEAKAGITRISFPTTTQAGRSQKLAYVEFGDEAAMKLALTSHAEKLNDAIPDLKQATDRETREKEREQQNAVGGGGFTANPAFSSGRGGRGRGRGGQGGYASRGLAMAGLTSARGRGGPGGQAQAQGGDQGAAPDAPASS